MIAIGMLAALGLAAGCSTASGSRKSGGGDPIDESTYLTTAETRKDPERIICRRHKPTGSRISEKICMTARQWQQQTDETQRVLDRAQRRTGGTEGT